MTLPRRYFRLEGPSLCAIGDGASTSEPTAWSADTAFNRSTHQRSESMQQLASKSLPCDRTLGLLQTPNPARLAIPETSHSTTPVARLMTCPKPKKKCCGPLAEARGSSGFKITSGVWCVQVSQRCVCVCRCMCVCVRSGQHGQSY